MSRQNLQLKSSQLKTILIISLIIILAVLAAVIVIQNAGKSGNYQIQSKINKNESGVDAYHKVAVKNTITKKWPKIQEIYNHFLTSNPPVKEGLLYVDWQVQSSGKVKTSEVVTSDFKNQEFEKNITDEIKTWVFPPPPTGQATYCDFKFYFKSSQNNDQSSDKKDGR